MSSRGSRTSPRRGRGEQGAAATEDVTGMVARVIAFASVDQSARTVVGDGFPGEAIRGEGKWGAAAWRTSLRVRPWRGKVQTASAAEREC